MVDETPLSIAQRLKGYKSAFVLSHVFPDADALGSAGAMVLGLISIGIDAKLHLGDSIPERMQVLLKCVPVQETISGGVPLVVVDTASKERMGIQAEELPADHGEIVNIDHHISNSSWGDVNLISAEDPAAAGIVLRVLVEAGAKITDSIANLLLAGLMEDTGSFRFANTSREAFNTAAELIQHGAEPEFVANQLYFNVPERIVRLRGLAIPKISKELDGKVAILVVSKEMLDAASATADDTEGLVDEVRALRGTLASVLIRQRDSSWKVSLRSKVAQLDVNLVAGKFSGGGHQAAAGCTMEGPIQDVCQRVLEAISEQLPDK